MDLDRIQEVLGAALGGCTISGLWFSFWVARQKQAPCSWWALRNSISLGACGSCLYPLPKETERLTEAAGEDPKATPEAKYPLKLPEEHCYRLNTVLCPLHLLRELASPEERTAGCKALSQLDNLNISFCPQAKASGPQRE